MSNDKKFEELFQLLEEQGAQASTLAKLREHTSHILSESESFKRELAKFQLMVDWTPCTISWIKEDLTYRGVNKTLCDLCELEKEDFIGKPVGTHTKQIYFKKFSEDLFQSEDESHSIDLSTTIDGEEKKFYLVGTKFNNDQEAVIIGLDITELSKLQQTVGLMERLSSLGEMVAGIVHEINNPLTVIKNKAAMIKKYEEKGQAERVIEASEKIEETCGRMGKIIEGVKSFVRQGQMDPHTDAFINDTLREAALLLESKLKDADVELILPSGSGGLIEANQTQIYQVFVNLLTNSIDAIRDLKDRWIKVESFEESSGMLKLIFLDSGPGIPEETAKHIFDSFYTTKGKGKGTGLGLSLCRKIIEGHGGDISIDFSQKNTTFVIHLPMSGQEKISA